MSTNELNVLETVRVYLGDERIGNPEHMPENWTVTQFKDASLARPRFTGKGCHGFIVRGSAVESVDDCSGNAEAAYARLCEHVAA